MAQFTAYDKKVEVNGETVISLVDGMGAFDSTALGILEEHGIVEPKAGKWYSQQAWLDSFKEIATRIGDKTLFQIGRKIPENALWPPDVNSVDKGLASVDVAYHMNHRGGPIGNYRFEQFDEKSGKMICDNPYPCDFDRGIIAAVVDRFKGQGSMTRVTHDDSGPCRKKGADSCTYLINW